MRNRTRMIAAAAAVTAALRRWRHRHQRWSSTTGSKPSAHATTASASRRCAPEQSNLAGLLGLAQRPASTGRCARQRPR